MENALIFKKEVDIELMKFQHDVLLLEESDYIDSFSDDYYMESSDMKTEGFFEKLVKKVRDLIKKIKDKISEAFSKEKVKKEQEKFKLKIQQDPSYKNKKVKVVVNDKVIALDKKAITELSKCKTVEEAEKYVSNYKKKRQMLVTGAVVSVSAIAAIGMLGNKLHKSHQQLDELQSLYKSTMTDLEKKSIELEWSDKLCEQKEETSRKLRNKLLDANGHRLLLQSDVDFYKDQYRDEKNKNSVYRASAVGSKSISDKANTKIKETLNDPKNIINMKRTLRFVANQLTMISNLSTSAISVDNTIKVDD